MSEEAGLEAREDWRLPYRSMDASGEPDTAEAVGWRWIEEVAHETARDREGERLIIHSPQVQGDGRVIALYEGTKPIAVATIYRDEMNFAVLVRWRSPDPQLDAANALLREAGDVSDPFATFADHAVDDEGWSSTTQRERIVDWFGPTDFHRAKALYAKISIYLKDGR